MYSICFLSIINNMCLICFLEIHAGLLVFDLFSLKAKCILLRTVRCGVLVYGLI